MMMTNRVKLWLGASALALAGTPTLSPIASGMLGIDLAGEAWAQESGDESGEGAEAECTTDESGEGEEGGATECPEPTGEEGEGEGEGG